MKYSITPASRINFFQAHAPTTKNVSTSTSLSYFVPLKSQREHRRNSQEQTAERCHNLSSGTLVASRGGGGGWGLCRLGQKCRWDGQVASGLNDSRIYGRVAG